jgi:hypothetical protein
LSELPSGGSAFWRQDFFERGINTTTVVCPSQQRKSCIYPGYLIFLVRKKPQVTEKNPNIKFTKNLILR